MIVLVIVKNSVINISRYRLKFVEVAPGIFYSIENKSIHESVSLNEKGFTLKNSSQNIDNFSEYSHDLKGEFSYGIYDFNKKQFTGRRDKLGVKPFYFHDSKDLFIFSTSLKAIKEILQFTTVNLKWLSRALSGIPSLENETFFNEINQLPAGHKLCLNENTLNIEKYWELSELKETNLKDFSICLKNTIVKYSGFKNASELSGGLDSSGVVGVLAKEFPNDQLEVFRHVMDDQLLNSFFPFGDERKYSDLISDSKTNIIVNDIASKSKGILKEMAEVMKIIGSPFFSTIVLFSDELYEEVAKKNRDVLFSGFGGDEVISSKAGFYLNELAHKAEWRKVKILLGNRWFSLKLIKLYLKSKFSFLNFYTWQKEKLGNSLLNAVFIEEFAVSKQFWVHHKRFEARTLNESIINRINNPAINTRITENGQYLTAKGVEYTFPLLDVDLIECYLGLPSDVKYNKDMDRWPFRQAIKPFVPIEIYNRQDKTSSTIPTVFYRFMNDYDNIEAFLEKYKNGKASEYVNIEKMQKVLPLIKAKAEGKKVKKRLDLRIFIIGLQMILYFDEGVLD